MTTPKPTIASLTEANRQLRADVRRLRKERQDAFNELRQLRQSVGAAALAQHMARFGDAGVGHRSTLAKAPLAEEGFLHD